MAKPMEMVKPLDTGVKCASVTGKRTNHLLTPTVGEINSLNKPSFFKREDGNLTMFFSSVPNGDIKSISKVFSR